MITRNFHVIAALLFLWPTLAVQSAEVSYQFSMPTNLVVGSNFTTSVILTNSTGQPFFNVQVSFAFSDAIEFVSGEGATTSGNTVTFSGVSIPNDVPNATTNLSFVAKPLNAGQLTNALTIISAGFSTLNTSFVASVVGPGDLAVAVEVPSFVIVGDSASYSITITNASSSFLSGISITSALPTNTIFLGVTPTNGIVTSLNNSVMISGAVLPRTSSFTYEVLVQPNSTGQLAFITTVDSSRIFDTDRVNNSALAFLNVLQPDTNQFSFEVSAPVLNRQTGLYNQSVQLVNTSSLAVASARVVVVGLTNLNRLYNASGSNAGNPFVVYPAAINAGAAADLVLEFYYPSRQPQTNLAYIVYGVAEPDLHTSTNGVTIITLITNYPGNLKLIEFISVPGKSYRVVYSDEPSFTNALMAVPPIVAPANRTQWIDEGPPKTISKPDSGMRFYRVLEQ